MSDPNIIKLSVILPTYNGGKYLKLAVTSILNQSFKNFEIIILDDGSTDGSIDVLRSFNDKRIQILSDGKNRGLSYRLNEGIKLSKGQYLARMDADDISFPDRFEKQLDYLENNPTVDLLSTRVVVFNDYGNLIGLLPFKSNHKSICSHPWLTIPMPHPTWMARRDWYVKHKYKLPELVRAEDQELLLRSMKMSEFACLPNILLAYRQGPVNFAKTFRARRNLLKAQINIFIANGNFIFVLLSTLTFIIKIFIDLITSRLRFNSSFSFRNHYAIPIEIEEIVKNIINQNFD